MIKLKSLPGRTAILAAAGGALLIAGIGAGAAITHAASRPEAMAPVSISPISSLKIDDAERSVTSVKGRVVEVFGSNFVVDDGTGRALIETGPAEAGDAAVSVGQVVTVQGRFDAGVIRPSFLVGADGKVVALGWRDEHREHGPRGDREDRHEQGGGSSTQVAALQPVPPVNSQAGAAASPPSSDPADTGASR